jgi:hypothetical protein
MGHERLLQATQSTGAPMTKLLDEAIERVRTWPADRQKEIAELLLALDGDERGEADADDPGLEADLDAALAEVEQGKFADPKDVEAFFAKHRK